MSAIRGLYLRLTLTKNQSITGKQLTSTFGLLLGALFVAFAFSTHATWASFASSSWSRAKKTSEPAPAAGKRGSAILTKGPALSCEGKARYSSFQAAPFQACTVNCNATVPASGQPGAGVSFQASAAPSGCSGQPSYSWNFGDGSSNSNEQNPTHSYSSPGTYTWTLTTSVASGATSINTVAGGFGEGTTARQTPFGKMTAIARDPRTGGIFIADTIGGEEYIRYINTSAASVTIAGKNVDPGIVRTVAGGGLELSDNVPAGQTELSLVYGLAVSPDGNLLYYSSAIDGVVRAINISAAAQTVRGLSLGVGNVATLGQGFGDGLAGLAVHPTTGVVFAADATAGVNKVYSISAAGDVAPVAGSGAATTDEAAFSAGPALNTPLFQPRAVEVEADGNLLIADTGHARIIRVSGGAASLVNQFAFIPTDVRNLNPLPSGVAVAGGNAFIASGNRQAVDRVTGGVSLVAGQLKPSGLGITCDYSGSNCGDGGPAASAGFKFLSSSDVPPIVGIEGDSNGVFVLDQGNTGRGRIRYINLSGAAVTVAGTPVAAGAIETIAGNGLTEPYDGGPATGATFKTPVGVAPDANGNLWISDTLSGRLRFANRSGAPVTLFAGAPAQQIVPAGAIITVNKDVTSGSDDGGPANQAEFDSPQGLFVTSQGVYVVDSRGGPQVPQELNGRRTGLVRFINTTGANVTFYPGSSSPIVVPPGNIARIVGGSGSPGGEGSFAINAALFGASDVAVTSDGVIYVTDVAQRAVRKVNAQTGVMTTVAGLNGKQFTGVGLDASNRLYVANYEDGVVLRENNAGAADFANLATGLNKPRDVAVAADGTAYVTVGLTAAGGVNNHQLVQIPAGGAASVLLGSTSGFSGDGGPASAARINISPSPLVIGSGVANQIPQTVNIATFGLEVLFTDSNNNRVRSIGPSVTTCVKTGTITISGDAQTPTIASLNPTVVNVGNGAFTLTVNGTGYVPASVVQWNGAARPTTFVGNTQLTAQIPAADVAAAGSALITVFNPPPGGGTSNSATFLIRAPRPVPTLASINPTSAEEGGASFTVMVAGTGFDTDSVVRVDGQPRSTTFLSASQLSATFLANDIAAAGTLSITVFTPTPGGGVSNSLPFTVTAGSNPMPALLSLNPAFAVAGGAPLTVTATGVNFVTGSKLRLNGTDLTTTITSPTELTASIPASVIATAGVLQATVVNPAPGGGTSGALAFVVNPSNGASNPAIAGLSPNVTAVVPANGQGFTLTVNGGNFVNGSAVRLNGTARATTFVSATQLTAEVPAADLTAAASYDVTVANPGNATASNAVKLTVAAKASGVSAASFTEGAVAGESIVALFGSGLATGVTSAQSIPLPTSLNGTTIKVKDVQGVERSAPLFFASPGQVNLQVPPGTSEGLATITAFLNNTIVGSGVMTVTGVAPGIFTANSDGVGGPAAVILRRSNGVDTFESTVILDPGTNRFVPAQIDLGGANDQLFLLLYGVGFRRNTGLANVHVKIGGVDIPVIYASVAPGFVGLDQANLGPLPSSLRGLGPVDLVLTVDGKAAPAVKLNFK